MDEQIRISFFRHEVNAINDEKLFKLYRKEGMAGYGVWWRLLEMLGAVKEHKLQRDYDDIAFKMYHPELADLIKRIVEEYGLFKTNKEYFWNSAFTAQMDELNTRYQKRAAAGSKGGKRKAELKQSQSNAVAMLTENDSNATTDKTREDESRIDTPCGISLSNDKENTQGVGDNTPTQQFVLEKKKNFIMVAMTCEGDYPKPLRKSFADYWTQPLQDNPGKMLFEEKRAFDIPVMLAKWAETEHPGKRAASAASGKTEEVISYDQYYKRYGTTICQDGWQTRRNEKKDCMEYYRKIEEE